MLRTAFVVGFTHLAAGDTSGSAFAEDAITRTAMVLGSGARQNIGAMPILGGVVTRNISDGLLNGQSSRPQQSMLFACSFWRRLERS